MGFFFCEPSTDQSITLELLQYYTSHNRCESFRDQSAFVTLCILIESVPLQIVLCLKSAKIAKMTRKRDNTQVINLVYILFCKKDKD